MIKKVFLESLPKTYGIGVNNNKLVIDWKNSIGYSVGFIYENVRSSVKIIDYDIKTKKIKIQYSNIIKNISVGSFKNCEFGAMLKKITSYFKAEIGQVFKDDKRDLIIMDREYRKDKNGRDRKWYKYKCNKCGAELWIVESSLFTGTNCACCENKFVVKGINDIETTNPELVKYFVNIEDAYTHTYCSGDRVLLKCPFCGFEKEMKISRLYKKRFSCSICGDGISYPEKVMGNLLKQLKIDFKTQLSKTTFKWCNKYYYDFYLKHNNEEYIIETHGRQHYEENNSFDKCGGRTSKEEKENDRIKKELALKNNIKEENYIIIDCRKSDLDFIKSNIINSKLNEVFDLSNIDWIEIDKKSQKSLIKEVCNYWKLHNEINREELTTKDLGKIFYLSSNTIIEYLNKGKKIGWCDYYAHNEIIKTASKNGKLYLGSCNKPKKVEIFKDGESLGSFNSVSELSEKSETLLKIYLDTRGISRVARGERKSYKGFVFKYI